MWFGGTRIEEGEDAGGQTGRLVSLVVPFHEVVNKSGVNFEASDMTGNNRFPEYWGKHHC